MEEVVNVVEWLETNKAAFLPPICNKLLHKKQLSVMFVGGPNQREDFHIEHGSEFFYQLKGNMALPIVVKGQRRHVDIKEGEVFLLPSRIPHSPQRPETGSIGLVIERERSDGELDGLRWYVDYEKCERVLYEKYFQCYDLGRDFAPVLKGYKASKEFASRVPGDHVEAAADLVVDTDSEVPGPFKLSEFLENNSEAIAQGRALNLFQGHPDKEMSVHIIGGGGSACTEETCVSYAHETWLYQLTGDAHVTVGGKTTVVSEGCCVVIHSHTEYTIERPRGSIGMVVKQDPTKNRPSR